MSSPRLPSGGADPALKEHHQIKSAAIAPPNHYITDRGANTLIIGGLPFHLVQGAPVAPLYSAQEGGPYFYMSGGGGYPVYETIDSDYSEMSVSSSESMAHAASSTRHLFRPDENKGSSPGHAPRPFYHPLTGQTGHFYTGHSEPGYVDAGQVDRAFVNGQNTRVAGHTHSSPVLAAEPCTPASPAQSNKSSTLGLPRAQHYVMTGLHRPSVLVKGRGSVLPNLPVRSSFRGGRPPLPPPPLQTKTPPLSPPSLDGDLSATPSATASSECKDSTIFLKKPVESGPITQL